MDSIRIGMGTDRRIGKYIDIGIGVCIRYANRYMHRCRYSFELFKLFKLFKLFNF